MAKDLRGARALIKKHGLTDLGELIENALVPAVFIDRSPPGTTRAPAKASRLGGLPALLSADDWPNADDRPLFFLAQIDLAKAPHHHLGDSGLPESGLLQVWYDGLRERLKNPTSSDIGPNVLTCTYQDSDTSLRRQPYPEIDLDEYEEWGQPWEPFTECRIKLKPALSITATKKLSLTRDHPEFDRDEEFFELQSQLLAGDAQHTHQLLGAFRPLQADPEFEAEAFRRGVDPFRKMSQADRTKLRASARRSKWRPLVVLTDDDENRGMVAKGPLLSSPGFSFGDGESLSLWIRDADLRKGRFDNTYTAIG